MVLMLFYKGRHGSVDAVILCMKRGIVKRGVRVGLLLLRALFCMLFIIAEVVMGSSCSDILRFKYYLGYIKLSSL